MTKLILLFSTNCAKVNFPLQQPNQRTNGPVNAHLTSGPGISTISNFNQILPCLKIGQGQPRVTIVINFVHLEPPMIHTKFQDHGTSASEE